MARPPTAKASTATPTAAHTTASGWRARDTAPAHTSSSTTMCTVESGRKVRALHAFLSRIPCVTSPFHLVFGSGYKHGKGAMKFVGGDTYDGDWALNKRDGEGVLRCRDGRSYVGSYRDDYKQGSGTYTYANGDVYSGSWAFDERCRRGLLRYANGDVYDGDFSVLPYKQHINNNSLITPLVMPNKSWNGIGRRTT
jgi:hypothetical protein